MCEQEEMECELPEYGNMGLFQDYQELCMQFGYVVLFAAACPLAPLLAFGSNVLETWIDSVKLAHTVKRPMPEVAKGIGSWLIVMQVRAVHACEKRTVGAGQGRQKDGRGEAW